MEWIPSIVFMPSIRHQHPRGKPFKRHRTGRFSPDPAAYPGGLLVNKDQDLLDACNGNLQEARSIITRRIQDVLRGIVGVYQGTPPASPHAHHSFLEPKLGTGSTDYRQIGAYMVVVSARTTMLYWLFAKPNFSVYRMTIASADSFGISRVRLKSGRSSTMKNLPRFSLCERNSRFTIRRPPRSRGLSPSHNPHIIAAPLGDSIWALRNSNAGRFPPPRQWTLRPLPFVMWEKAPLNNAQPSVALKSPEGVVLRLRLKRTGIAIRLGWTVVNTRRLNRKRKLW